MENILLLIANTGERERYAKETKKILKERRENRKLDNGGKVHRFKDQNH